MSEFKMPELPVPDCCYPGTFTPMFSAAAVDAHSRLVAQQMREACAQIAEQSHPQEWPFIGYAIRSIQVGGEK